MNVNVPCECRCGSRLFQIFITSQQNGNDDTYEFVCVDCQKSYAVGTMIFPEENVEEENF